MEPLSSHSGSRIALRTLAAALTLSIATPCPLATPLKAQGPPSGVPPKQIVAEAAEKEVKFLHYGPPYVRYRMHVIDAKGDQVRDVIQSQDGAVARLVARDNRPLTVEEDAAERSRLQAMIDSPATYLKHARGDASGKKVAQDLIRLMPDAMIFTYTEAQPQRAVAGSAAEIVIDYKPDPAWSPPTMTSSAFTGLEGRLWIDAKTHTLLAIEGRIFRGVNFGFLIAHIDPGGTLSMQQSEVAPNKWFFAHFVEHLTVRVPLIFKTIHENTEVTSSDFTNVNPMPFQDAIRMLLATPLPSH
jgi:hypothetical protein